MAVFDLTDDRPAARKAPFTDPDLKARHTRALDAFKASAAFFSQQREREMQDLKFVDFDEQWDPSVKIQRAGNQAVNGLPPTPPRPMITINQLRGPVQQLANTRRAARIGLEFAPKGAGSTQDVAEVYEDIARAMQAESRAAIARNWAADRAEKAGMGGYRIDTDYSQETPQDEASWNDQEIRWRRILNQGSVYPDPHAQEPDFSDGRRWYVTEDLPVETYRDRYPDSTLAMYDNGELQGIGDAQPKWVFTSANGSDGEESQTVRIAECWEVVEEERTLVMLTDGTASYEDDIPKGKAVATGPQARSRKKTTRVIYQSIMNAVEYLDEPREVNGMFVPLIPCIGEESNVDGERRWRGIVRPGKESAVNYNVMRSALTEAIANATKAPYIAYARVLGKFMEWWKQGPTRNFPFLPVEEAYDKAGQLLPLPTRTNAIDPGVIQATSLAAGAAKDDVHTTTGVPPVALGQLDPHDRSGKAISALQQQSEVGSSGYMDNFVSITMAYEGKVVRDLIRHLYDRPGRIVPAVGLDEKRRLIMLNAPYTEGKDGVPVMVPGWQPGMPIPTELPGPPPPPGKPPKPIPVHYIDMTTGEYSVSPTIGKSVATQREATLGAIGDVMKSVGPEGAMVLAPAWIEEQDWPGARKIAEIFKKALPPNLRAAYEDEQDGQMPPEAQAEIGQLKQMVQTLQQALETKQVEQQGKLQVVQVQEQAENQRSQAEQQVSIQKAEIAATASMANAQAKVDAENFRSYVDALEGRLAKSLDLHMQHLTETLTRTHEHLQNAADRAHEVGMEGLKHQHALEQGQQAAALAPAPTADGTGEP